MTWPLAIWGRKKSSQMGALIASLVLALIFARLLLWWERLRANHNFNRVAFRYCAVWCWNYFHAIRAERAFNSGDEVML